MPEAVRDRDQFPTADAEIPTFLAQLGLDGIVDLHVHAMPDRLQHAVWAFFDRLDDPPWPVTYRDDAESRLATLGDLGVIAHTALAYAHKPGMIDWLNDYTLGLAERHDRVIPTFTIYPESGVGGATEAAIARGGAVVKVHTQVGRFLLTDPRLDEAWHAIAAARLPVMVHATAVYGVEGGDEFCGVDTIRALLERHPDLVVVIAHVGMPQFDQAIDLAATSDHVHLDLSMTLHDGPVSAPVPDATVARLHDLAPRLTFGSDYPTIPHDYATQVRALARLQLADEDLRGVLADNATALLARRVPARSV